MTHITLPRAVVEQALHALANAIPSSDGVASAELHIGAITALRAALEASKEVEPVRELLISAAALAVASERQGKYEGAAWVADAILKDTHPAPAAPQPETP